MVKRRRCIEEKCSGRVVGWTGSALSAYSKMTHTDAPVEAKKAEFKLSLKGNKGQNQYLTPGFIGKIQVTFRKCVLYPDMVTFEISPLKVGIRSLSWDHRGRNPDKRS